MKKTWLTALALSVALGACVEDPDRAELDVDETAPVSPAPPAQADAQPTQQDAAGSAALAVAQDPQHGAYLTDGGGRALYMFTADQKGASRSACSDACAQAWPPFTAQGQPQLQGQQLDRTKVGSLQRADGQTQVTYGGWPLYHYALDTGPKTTKGQDVHGHGGEWYLVTPAGEKLAH